MPESIRGEASPASPFSFLAYVCCPSCRQRIKQPFSRKSGPVAFVHKSSACYARLIVTPDARGEAHRVEVLPQGITFETALERAIKAA